ncbi:hypothetical protein HZS_2390 [Henneguya salminicola]|nr:hypothetical protein HZS_2390 [Henneguya salminicola]
MTSPSSLIQSLDQDQNKSNNPYFIQYKMSSLIDDSLIWPYYSKDDYFGQVVSLDDPLVVDKDPYLQEFQKYWNFQAKFLVVDKILISPTTAKIKICSSLYADRHAGHLNILLPCIHPFYVESKGWCQVDSRNVFFKTLHKMDVITTLGEENFFKFEDNKILQPQPPPQEIQEIQEICRSVEPEPVTTISETQPSITNNLIPPKKSKTPTSKRQPRTKHEFVDNISYPKGYPMNYPSNYPGYPPFNPMMPGPYPGMYPPYYDPNRFSGDMTPEDYDNFDKVSDDNEPDSAKRPMNGFMLFARSLRLQLISENPGKDNRVISKLLGEKWKELSEEEKKKYSNEAKAISEKRMKVNPLCWKRKNVPRKFRQNYKHGYFDPGMHNYYPPNPGYPKNPYIYHNKTNPYK